MSEITKRAKEKIDAELKVFKGNNKAKAVSEPVAARLQGFCANERFAQAVLDSEKTLSDCCTATMKGVGQSISDLEVYRRAVVFYFPNAKVKCTMEIIAEGECVVVDGADAERVEVTESKAVVAVAPKTKRKPKEKAPDDTIQLSLF